MSKVKKQKQAQKQKQPSFISRGINAVIDVLIKLVSSIFNAASNAVAWLLHNLFVRPAMLIGGAVWRLFLRVRVLRPVFVAILFIALVFGFTISPLAPPAYNYFINATAQLGFNISDIRLEGRKRTSIAELEKAIGLERYQPIIGINLGEIHRRVERLTWVRKAVVARHLPDRLHIILHEYEPFAIYKQNKRSVLIDREGNAITRHHLKQFAHLPIFSGVGSLERTDADTLRADALMSLLEDYPVVRNRLVAAHWSKSRRWDLKLDHGGALHLPATNIREALDRLMRLERQRRVLADKKIIDLRLPDRILLRDINIIRPAPQNKTNKKGVSL